jgi:leucine dehydrogenase
MELFRRLEHRGHESVTFVSDPHSRLRMIIAVHNTLMGPALGGCRMWPYADMQEALTDVLRLSQAMTYKAAMAGLPYGGGKAVVIGDPKREKDDALLLAMGRAVSGLGGRYLITEDVGMTEADMSVIARTTRWLTGRSQSEGGSGDPSVPTAEGLFASMKVCLEQLGEPPTVKGKTIAIQGLGKVGSHLAHLAADEGAKLFVSDIDSARLEHAVTELRAVSVIPAEIMTISCDIFSPCALGGVLNEKSVPALNCRIVAGAANNQLASDVDGDVLFGRGILYAPDYVVNAGGLINLSFEADGYHRDRAMAKVKEIPTTLRRLFEQAKNEAAPPHRVSDRIVEERLSRARAEQEQGP